MYCKIMSIKYFRFYLTKFAFKNPFLELFLLKINKFSENNLIKKN